MADFPLCFSFVLPNEDYTPPRYESIPDPVRNVDLDAMAISGINSHYWPEDFAAIVAIPQAQRGPAVQDFYQRQFWNTWLAQLISNKLAAMVLDAGVNQGSGWAVKFAQTAAGLAESAVDGHFGPITLAAINSAPVANLVPAFIAARQVRYREIGGPSLPAWLVRASRIPNFD